MVVAIGLVLLPFVTAKAEVATFRGCTVDTETFAIPSYALESRFGHLYLSHPFVHLFFAHERNQLAPVYLPESGWAYIDRDGRVVVQNVATMDNGANAFHDGLVRITHAGKWGLADMRGRMVVPLRYDGMLDYQSGLGWKACTGCRTVTAGEHSWFEGGVWVALQRGANNILTERSSSDH